jgi:nicotinamide-nucleotide amidase
MKAEIIAIGSELIHGEKLNSNSQWLSARLGCIGIPVRFHTTLGDDLAENVDGFRIALERADVILVTGGIGPTQDDLTREALAQVAGVPLVENPQSLAEIRAFFGRRNRVMTERNNVQAWFPEGATPISNRVGTAPGIAMDVGRSFVACLPGVPYEMKVMFDEQVVPLLKARGLGGRVIVHRVLNLFGRGEADIESNALDLTARGRRPEVGITASDATISFRVSCDGATEEEAQREIEPTLAIIRERFGELVLGENEINVTEALVLELERTGLTIATAESCTGGLIGSRLTAISGVGFHYLGGVISYSNEAKVAMLGVPHALIQDHGAVSAEVAESMAMGALGRFGADLAISVTGVAGPTGGTPNKPVGLVWLGLATKTGVWSKKLELGPEQPRDVIRSRAAKYALNWARLEARGYPDRPEQA